MLRALEAWLNSFLPRHPDGLDRAEGALLPHLVAGGRLGAGPAHQEAVVCVAGFFLHGALGDQPCFGVLSVLRQVPWAAALLLVWPRHISSWQLLCSRWHPQGSALAALCLRCGLLLCLAVLPSCVVWRQRSRLGVSVAGRAQHAAVI